MNKRGFWLSMKYFIFTAFLAGLLILAGCGKTAETEEETTAAPETTENAETEAPEPEYESVKDMVLYWNVERDEYAHKTEGYLSSRPKDKEDGMYHFLLASTENRQVTRRSPEPAIKNRLDEYRLVYLKFDENNLIVDVKNAADVTGGLIAEMFYVEKVEDNVVTAYSSNQFRGEKAEIDLTGVKIFDCSNRAMVTGERSTVEALDPLSRIICVADFDGTPAMIFIFSRPKAEMKLQEHHVCPECGENVEWWGWNQEKELPSTEGHYFLLNDVVVSAQDSLLENQHVVLCLNGFNVTGTGKRTVSLHNPGCSFTLCDCQEKGCISTQYKKGHNGTTQGAVVWARYGTFKMYGGILDGSAVLTESTGATVCINANASFELYGGTIIGGAANYGSAVRINDKANFKMTGGKMYGGNTVKREEGDVLDIIGANGTVSITGGTITGGAYVASRKEITLGGSVVISGEKNGLYLADTTKIRLEPFAGNASVGITLGNCAGVFTNNYVSGSENVFTSDDPNLKVAAGGGVLSLVEKVPHVHCECGTGTVTAGGHTHASAVWQPWTKKNALPKENGYYYLKNNVKLTSGYSVANGVNVYICLNGYNIEQSSPGVNPSTGNIVNPRIVNFGGSNTKETKCVVTNCGKCDGSHGRLYRSNKDSYNGQGAMLWTGKNTGSTNTLVIYNANLDARNYNTSHGEGGLALMVQNSGAAKLFNVRITGGTATNGVGGAITVTGGELTIYDSTVTGGTAAKKGGAISVSGGSLTLVNTKVSGGTAPLAKNVMVSGGFFTVEGNTTIEEVYLGTGCKITVGELGPDAKIGIEMDDASDAFATGLTEDIASHFTTSGGKSIVYDEDEKALYISGGSSGEAHQHCICGTGTVTAGGHAHETVDFVAWKQTDALPVGASGKTKYYYLTADVKVSAQINALADATVVLCLNGHKVTAEMNGRLLALNAENAKYVITNCGARDDSHGVIVKTQTERLYDNQGGLIWMRYASDQVELYNVVMNGGTHRIARGGGVIETDNGSLKAVNVLFKGGVTTGVQNAGGAVNADGGALCLNGTNTLYDSEIQGGTSAGNGGSLAIRGGSLLLSNVKVSGGTASGKGKGVFVGGGSVTLSGKVSIDELYLASGKTVSLKSLSEESRIAVSMEDGKGSFALDVFNDLSGAFSSLDPAYEVRYAGKDLEILLASPSDPLPEEGDDPTTPHEHCFCGTGTVTAGGHTCANLTWVPWESTTALPTGVGEENGKAYYLAADVTITIQQNAVADSAVYLCLNGHKVTATNNGRFLAQNAENSRYVITNCKEKSDTSGVIVNIHTARKYDNQGGLVWMHYATDTLELYHVTLDGGTHQLAKNGGVIANEGGTLKAVDVTFKGGVTTGVQNSGATVNADGGALYLKGTNALYDSVVTGAVSAGKGGGIAFVSGTLILENTRVSGSTSTGVGKGVYSAGDLILTKGTVIDELYLASGKKITVNELTAPASIGIFLADGEGVFAADVTSDLTARFASLLENASVKYDSDAKTLSVAVNGSGSGDENSSESSTEEESTEPPVVEHKHCICGTGNVSGDGHAHSTVVWEPWESSVTLPTGAGDQNGKYYYLTGNVTLGSTADFMNQVAGSTLYLCLNGYNINQQRSTRSVRLFTQNVDNARFVLTNCGAHDDAHGVLTSNYNHNQGGMLWLAKASSSFTAYHVTFDGSNCFSKSNNGAVIYANGTLTMVDVIIRNGTASSTDSYGLGGNLYVGGGTSALYQCTVVGGTAAGAGGGNAYVKAGTLLLQNTSMYAGKGAAGANVYVAEGGSLVLDNATLSGSAPAGYGNTVYVLGAVSVNGRTAADDILLSSGKTITVSGPIAGSSLGVRLQDVYGTFAFVAENLGAYFHALEPGAVIAYLPENQELRIASGE